MLVKLLQSLADDGRLCLQYAQWQMTKRIFYINRQTTEGPQNRQPFPEPVGIKLQGQQLVPDDGETAGRRLLQAALQKGVQPVERLVQGL